MLQDHECNFATNEKEAFGCLWAAEHWEKYLLGQHFTIQIDHRIAEDIAHATHFIQEVSQVWQMVGAASRFNYDIQHICGEHNYMADALSRLVCPLQNCAITGDEATKLEATIVLLQQWPILLESIQQHTDMDDMLHIVK